MTYKPLPGEDIHDTATRIALLANQNGEIVTATFNDVAVTANPHDDPAVIVAQFHAECERRRKEYESSPEYAARKKEWEEADKRKQAALSGALLAAPAHMSLRDPAAWRKSVEANTDPYGSAVIRYAETWARVMETRIANGDTVSGCAEDASHIADTEGITGFMYGCAVGILAQVWTHGEELRRWHNLKTQIRNEGERANETGGVLNPALLCLGGGGEA